jgi:hypothetical protein
MGPENEGVKFLVVPPNHTFIHLSSFIKILPKF